jgi:hypothetical protein
MEKNVSKSNGSITLTTDTVMQVLGQSRSTASIVLRAMTAANQARVVGARAHWDHGKRIGGRPSVVYEASTSALKAFFGDKVNDIADLAMKESEGFNAYGTEITKENDVKNEVQKSNDATHNANIPHVGDAPNQSTGKSYGVKRDGTPKQKPGRKAGTQSVSAVKAEKVVTPANSPLVAALLQVVELLKKG